MARVPFPSNQQCFLWHPPPAAAGAAVEQLSFSRHKRPDLLHMFVCPRLLTQMWRKQLLKVADLVFTLPVGSRPNMWPASMYEPLVIGLVLPFLPVFPWIRRRTPTLLEVESQLRGVWDSPEGSECGNFGNNRGGRVVCYRVWCGQCYTPHPWDRFHISVPVNESGFECRTQSLQFTEVQAGKERGPSHGPIPV